MVYADHVSALYVKQNAADAAAWESAESGPPTMPAQAR
jgi:hypothetical protein